MNVFDLHCDTIYECFINNRRLDDETLDINFSEDIPDGKWQQFFACFIPDEVRGVSAVQLVFGLINELNRQCGLFPQSFCDTPVAGKCRPLISVESGAALAGNIENLTLLYNAGVRMLTLTWNGENELGFGQEAGGHLKPFGKKAVIEMQRLGITVDVSHLSDEGFDDVMSLSTAPVCASHSASRSICPHKRNLTDSQFLDIMRTGGRVGLVLADRFLRDGGESGMKDILAHTEHFLALGGENTLCLGSDFDGTALPQEITGVKALGRLYEYLLSGGIPQRICDKIFYENAACFFARE